MISQIQYAFAGIFLMLIIASIVTSVLDGKYPRKSRIEIKLRIKTWWWLVAILVVALGFDRKVAIVIFGIVSFMAFKEYLSIIPTRRADHRVLLLAYLAIPLQYLWVWTSWYGMFIVFIPVYVFLLLPMRMVLIGDIHGFLRAASTVQWGLMTTVFSISHIAYLLNLPAHSNSSGRVTGEMLVFYLIVLTEANDVAQYLWGKMLGRHRVAPTVSPNKTVEGLFGGIVTTTVFAWLLAQWFTPMSSLHAICAGILISMFGFIGDVVISAVKRDIGIKDSGNLLPGHGGILDRLDSLTYTAPLFFHYIYYLYF